MSGDKPECAEVVTTHTPQLRRRARRLARQHHDAEDLVQDTLLRAWRGYHRFDGANPGAWLNTILRNVAIDATEAARRRPTLVPGDDAEALNSLSESTQPTPSVEDLVIDGVLDPDLQAACAALTSDQRTALYLRAAGYSYEEIARLTEVPLGTVMSRLNRARTAARAHLARSTGRKHPNVNTGKRTRSGNVHH